jgi:rubrerythrin
MKNANYNLVKLLLNKLDDAWRVEKHYAKDARESSCKECQAMMKKILADEQRHVEMLRTELAKHIKGKKFD